ncbi:class II aldolase/adducin family protein [Pseudonocardia parietis]|uniref:L-fuculose-phosphate aldolase n=1 Tax=Pseudonocardia parietis TaxID=570936 RepID=A0ABS4VZM5_9PSEU|nr:class II aldolase/adducin family protein [Pseudonocardia parietis]MBP2369403.1 L-fuculose-phosphate aldolase [Pseudonocardia parietis]
MTTISGRPASTPVTGEDDPRFRIAAARRILHREGLDSQVGGHVSLRVPGEDAFWVTPFQYFDETLPEHVSKVGFGLEVLEHGTLEPSPGINFHASIYRARPDVNCVIHTHGFHMSVLTTTGVPFGMYYDYSSLFHEDVEYFKDDPTMVPSEEGELMAKVLGEKRALLMSHHGSLHVGSSLETTSIEAVLLELCSRYQLAAMAVNGTELDEQTVRSYRHAYLKYGLREQMWEANYRRLRRSDPDLFESLPQS